MSRIKYPNLLVLSASAVVALTACNSDRVLGPGSRPHDRAPNARLQLAAGVVDVRIGFNGEPAPFDLAYHDENYDPTPNSCMVYVQRSDYYARQKCADPLVVPPGAYSISVSWYGTEVMNEPVTIGAGDAFVRVIELSSRSMHVVGRYTKLGQPDAGRSVCGLTSCVLTDSEGRFAFIAPPGDGMIDDRAFTSPGAGGTVDLGDLAEGKAWAQFDLVFAGQPVPHAYYGDCFVSGVTHRLYSECGALAMVTPGTGPVTWEWLRLAMSTETFTISAGETARRTLDITDRASLVTGTLTYNGVPVEKTLNNFFIYTENYGVPVTTDAAGHFSVLIPRGTPQLTLGMSDGRLYSRTINATGQTTDVGTVDFSFPAIRVLVRYGTEPLPNCNSIVRYSAYEGFYGGCGETTTARAGTASVVGVYAGLEFGESSVTLVDGQTTTVLIDASTVLGKVTGALSLAGRPMPAGRYVCYYSTNWNAGCTTTDASGQFSLHVPAGAGEIKVDGIGIPYTVTAGHTVDISGDVPGDTPAGSGVIVAPVDPVTGSAPATITFGNVLSSGATTISTTTFGSSTLPSPEGLFAINGRSVVVDINTTATFSGTITVCLNYAQLGATGNPKTFRLMHYEESRGRWVNITTTNNIAEQIICGETSSLSPFTIAQALPVISAPGNLSVGTDYAVCSANVAAGAASATTDGDLVSVVGARNDARALDAPWSLGTTLITWTATDADGLTSTATQSVLVADREKPVLSVPPDITVNTDAGRATAIVAKPIASATDNCGRVGLKVFRTDKRELSEPYPLGKTTLEWNAADDAGNLTRAFQTVTVVDAEAPALIMPDSKTMNATTPSGVFFSYVVKAKDNVEVKSTKCDRPFESVLPIGTTVVTCVASDAAGNVGTGKFTMTVLGAPEQIVNLIEFVSGTPIPTTQRSALIAMLESALADARSTKKACHTFEKFIASVSAGTRTTISPELAAQILADATRIKAVMGCP